MPLVLKKRTSMSGSIWICLDLAPVGLRCGGQGAPMVEDSEVEVTTFLGFFLC
jgi:hypothetical protein